METQQTNSSFPPSNNLDAGFDQTLQQVKHEWGNFWTCMAIFGALVCLVIILFR
jgi:hypothetical protein